LEPSRRSRQLHLLERDSGKDPQRPERARKLLADDSAQILPVVFLRWVLDGQLEGVNVSGELLQEGDNGSGLTSEVQLSQLRAGPSLRVSSGPAKCSGLLNLGEVEFGEDSAIPGPFGVGGGPSRSGRDLVEERFDVAHALVRQVKPQGPQLRQLRNPLPDLSVQRTRCDDRHLLQQVLVSHDPREIFWQRAEACERETVESGTGGEDSEEIGEVRELVADFQCEGLETSGEEDLSAIQTSWGVTLPREVSEIGKDPLTWATTLENWEDGSWNVVCTLFVRDLLHTVGVG